MDISAMNLHSRRKGATWGRAINAAIHLLPRYCTLIEAMGYDDYDELTE